MATARLRQIQNLIDQCTDPKERDELNKSLQQSRAAAGVVSSPITPLASGRSAVDIMAWVGPGIKSNYTGYSPVNYRVTPLLPFVTTKSDDLVKVSPDCRTLEFAVTNAFVRHPLVIHSDSTFTISRGEAFPKAVVGWNRIIGLRPCGTPQKRKPGSERESNLPWSQAICIDIVAAEGPQIHQCHEMLSRIYGDTGLPIVHIPRELIPAMDEINRRAQAIYDANPKTSSSAPSEEIPLGGAAPAAAAASSSTSEGSAEKPKDGQDKIKGPSFNENKVASKQCLELHLAANQRLIHQQREAVDYLANGRAIILPLQPYLDPLTLRKFIHDRPISSSVQYNGVQCQTNNEGAISTVSNDNPFGTKTTVNFSLSVIRGDKTIIVHGSNGNCGTYWDQVCGLVNRTTVAALSETPIDHPDFVDDDVAEGEEPRIPLRFALYPTVIKGEIDLHRTLRENARITDPNRSVIVATPFEAFGNPIVGVMKTGVEIDDESFASLFMINCRNALPGKKLIPQTLDTGISLARIINANPGSIFGHTNDLNKPALMNRLCERTHGMAFCPTESITFFEWPEEAIGSTLPVGMSTSNPITRENIKGYRCYIVANASNVGQREYYELRDAYFRAPVKDPRATAKIAALAAEHGAEMVKAARGDESVFEVRSTIFGFTFALFLISRKMDDPAFAKDFFTYVDPTYSQEAIHAKCAENAIKYAKEIERKMSAATSADELALLEQFDSGPSSSSTSTSTSGESGQNGPTAALSIEEKLLVAPEAGLVLQDDEEDAAPVRSGKRAATEVLSEEDEEDDHAMGMFEPEVASDDEDEEEEEEEAPPPKKNKKSKKAPASKKARTKKSSK